MKVLLSAYSCLPNAGSEPAIGWNWAKWIAASGHQVFVITRAINREAIEAEGRGDTTSNPRFIFHDLPPSVQKLYSLPFGNYLYYTLWQYTAANRAMRLHVAEEFDSVQHITWGSFRLPSFMGKLKIPFVLGPVAGGEDTPKDLRKGLGWRGRLWDLLRRFSNATFLLNPFTRATFASASEIVLTTEETLRKIPRVYRSKCKVQQAIGIDPGSVVHFGSSKRMGPAERTRSRLELVYVGRLLPWKGLHLGLKALARLNSNGACVHLTVVGSGPDETRLKKLAQRLQISDLVTWVPWMRREDLIATLRNYDLFLFPSLHDSGGMAVLEAMMSGLPVVCLDLGGPAVSVDATCGKVIPTQGADEAALVEGIAEFIAHALEDPAMLKQLSQGARQRASTLTWQASVSSVYGQPLAFHAQ